MGHPGLPRYEASPAQHSLEHAIADTQPAPKCEHKCKVSKRKWCAFWTAITFSCLATSILGVGVLLLSNWTEATIKNIAASIHSDLRSVKAEVAALDSSIAQLKPKIRHTSTTRSLSFFDFGQVTQVPLSLVTPATQATATVKLDDYDDKVKAHHQVPIGALRKRADVPSPITSAPLLSKHEPIYTANAGATRSVLKSYCRVEDWQESGPPIVSCNSACLARSSAALGTGSSGDISVPATTVPSLVTKEPVFTANSHTIITFTNPNGCADIVKSGPVLNYITDRCTGSYHAPSWFPLPTWLPARSVEYGSPDHVNPRVVPAGRSMVVEHGTSASPSLINKTTATKSTRDKVSTTTSVPDTDLTGYPCPDFFRSWACAVDGYNCKDKGNGLGLVCYDTRSPQEREAAQKAKMAKSKRIKTIVGSVVGSVLGLVFLFGLGTCIRHFLRRCKNRRAKTAIEKNTRRDIELYPVRAAASEQAGSLPVPKQLSLASSVSTLPVYSRS